MLIRSPSALAPLLDTVVYSPGTQMACLKGKKRESLLSPQTLDGSPPLRLVLSSPAWGGSNGFMPSHLLGGKEENRRHLDSLL